MKNKFLRKTIILITAVAFFLLTAHAQDSKYENYHITKTDPQGVKKETIKTYIDDHQYKIVLVNDQLTELYIDNKKIEKEKFPEFDSTVSSIRERIKKDEEQGEIDRAQGNIDRKQGDIDREQGDMDRAHAAEDKKVVNRDREMMESLIIDLVSAQIIKNKESLFSLALTDSAFIVNGKKQPENIHQKFKTKYDRWAGNGVSYGQNQIDGTSIFFRK
jgi:hypothetical protein